MASETIRDYQRLWRRQEQSWILAASTTCWDTQFDGPDLPFQLKIPVCKHIFDQDGRSSCEVITPIGMAAFSGFAQPGSPDKMRLGRSIWQLSLRAQNPQIKPEKHVWNSRFGWFWPVTAYNLLLTTLTTSFLFCVASQFFLGRNSTDHGRFDLLGMDKLLSRVWKMVPCHGIHGGFRLSIPSMGEPQNRWFVNVYNLFIMENPMKKGDLGGSPISGNHHIHGCRQCFSGFAGHGQVYCREGQGQEKAMDVWDATVWLWDFSCSIIALVH